MEQTDIPKEKTYNTESNQEKSNPPSPLSKWIENYNKRHPPKHKHDNVKNHMIFNGWKWWIKFIVQTLIMLVTVGTLFWYIHASHVQFEQTQNTLNWADSTNKHTREQIGVSKESNRISDINNKKSLAIAESAFCAAKKSSMIYEMLTKDELRPYVTIQIPSPIKVCTTKIIETFYTIINSGKTPAINVIPFSCFIDIDTGKIGDNTIQRQIDWLNRACDRHDKQGITLGAMYPLVKVVDFGAKINTSEFLNLKNGEHVICLIIFIRYYDRYNMRHETLGCYYFDPDSTYTGSYPGFNRMN